MASFGKLTNAFLSVSQENTLAFANVNFDFSIIRLEAPEAYRGIGELISPRRKRSAEDGSSHKTARKLAALFQSAIPEVPSLIDAYGRRSTEIAKATKQTNGRVEHGIFAEHVGADATSLWAAATSGHGAIHLHLLACLLARIWKRGEAVSIWSQLVDCRRESLRRAITDNDITTFNLADVSAARIEISRQELDEWDASARSWVQLADSAKELQQTQVRLIVSNLSLPVSTRSSPYDAVLEAWKGAMTALDCLVQGTPQSIQNGSLLLGLYSWHIFPDILLADTNRLVQQNDSLVKRGGIVSVGLQNAPRNVKGVYWSLPLAHARFYGEPIQAMRHTGIGDSRVDFEKFLFIVLGMSMYGWKFAGVSLEQVLNFIQRLSSETTRRFFQDPSRKLRKEELSRLEWLQMLASVSAKFSNFRGPARDEFTRLISFGAGNSSNALYDKVDRPEPVFGLLKLTRIFQWIPERTEARLAFLRAWARQELPENLQLRAVIRYKDTPISKYKMTQVLLTDRSNAKRLKTDIAATPLTRSSYLVWQYAEAEDPKLPWADWPEALANDPELHRGGPQSNVFFMPPSIGAKPTVHIHVCGDPSIAAIFIEKDSDLTIPRNKLPVKEIRTKTLLQLLTDGVLMYDRLALAFLSKPDFGSYGKSLSAVRKASQIYEKLSGAKVDISEMNAPIHEAKWWQAASCSEKATPEIVFSCIAFFETGFVDIEPNAVGKHTFAISHGSSLFVASELLMDPAETLPEVPVERLVGNIGRAGLALLVTPPNPMIRKLDLKSWSLVSQGWFKGEAQDSFNTTSFHLAFTGHEIPIDLSQRSARDVSASFIETAISLHENGEWIADLDVMKLSSLLAGWRGQNSCAHDEEQKRDRWFFGPMECVDSCIELLGTGNSQSTRVVRAHANKVSRLATAALAMQLSHPVLVMPLSDCWACLAAHITAQPHRRFVLPDDDEDDDAGRPTAAGASPGSAEDDDGGLWARGADADTLCPGPAGDAEDGSSDLRFQGQPQDAWESSAAESPRSLADSESRDSFVLDKLHKQEVRRDFEEVFSYKQPENFERNEKLDHIVSGAVIIF